MSESHRSLLKLNISAARHALPDESKSTTTPAATTPSRLILKTKRPSVSLSANDIHVPPAQPLTTTKAGRLSKPSAKKREHDEYGDEEIPITVNEPPSKRRNGKGKLNLTRVKLTSRRVPIHPPGDGYDSEASDREIDPAIEEQVIFRMLPGEHCEYIRKAVEENKICSRKEGGADFRIRFLSEESRRAVVTVKGQLFVAVLLDLPTITEGMKSWDRKSFMKSADISQILLVFKAVGSEEEAKLTPLPPMVESGFKWPHGLTPPMHDCVKRRFAKIISRKEIEDKEAEVERLLAADRASVGTRFEWVDERRPKTPADYEDDEDEDAEGDVDDTYYGEAGMEDAEGEDDAMDLEALFEAQMAADDLAGSNSNANAGDNTPATAVGSTPAANLQESIEEEEAESDEDDDDDDEEELDEEDQAHQDEVNAFKEEIAELKAQLKLKEDDLLKPNVANSAILKKRVQANIKSLKDEIRLKMSYINANEEEEENED
ncbi:hypothetical protein TD95_001389 [Thielaviopsis punctulata]|uniref:TAFII55 protein conserved region domain-containing protein n=1 Tax=Thielaviopsis punctulata TaxID=72032 RepID=A0A0F4Z780_9PEZI|nr:hypothetical protein TD95_001389 [Thielaviopsis punctulata]